MPQARCGFAIGLVLGLTVVGVSPMTLAQSSADERAVAQVIADREVAWNAGDADGYRRLLTPDADLSSSSGQIAHGRDAVIKLYLTQRAGVFAGATTSMKVVQTRLIKPDVAIVDVDRELTNLTAGQATPKARTTFVLVKESDGGWLVTAQRAGGQVVFSMFPAFGADGRVRVSRLGRRLQPGSGRGYAAGARFADVGRHVNVPRWWSSFDLTLHRQPPRTSSSSSGSTGLKQNLHLPSRPVVSLGS